MPVKGGKQLRRNFRKKINDISGRVTERTVREVLVTGASYAAVLTPVDTANLLNSQHVTTVRRKGNAIFGAVEYTAEYAVPVHDKKNQNFKKAAAESRFLVKGFERDGKEAITRILQKNYRT